MDLSPGWSAHQYPCACGLFLSDSFVCVTNINKHFWCRCRGRKTSAELTLSLALPCTYTFIFSFLFFTLLFFIFPFYILMDNINSITIFQFSAPTETNLVPWESSQPIETPSYRLSPWLIGIVQGLSFSGGVDKNPYLHIRDFEQTCDCLRIEGMSDQTLRWKLFPFSLKGKTRQ
jgi:hypothetical protein